MALGTMLVAFLAPPIVSVQRVTAAAWEPMCIMELWATTGLCVVMRRRGSVCYVNEGPDTAHAGTVGSLVSLQPRRWVAGALRPKCEHPALRRVTSIWFWWH